MNVTTHRCRDVVRQGLANETPAAAAAHETRLRCVATLDAVFYGREMFRPRSSGG